MNWHTIISVLMVVVLKVVGMTLFLMYFPQIFGKNDFNFVPTKGYATVCPTGWALHQGKCFLLTTSESSWNKSRSYCEGEGSTLAIVNTPEKLKFLQDIAGAEMYFIGLIYQPAEKRWRWINNSVFNGKYVNTPHSLGTLVGPNRPDLRSDPDSTKLGYGSLFYASLFFQTMSLFASAAITKRKKNEKDRKRTEMYFLTVQKVRSPNSGHWF
ncbi:C-type lectin domain family 5 member A isoform 1-T1 [Trichechus inunguis]